MTSTAARATTLAVGDYVRKGQGRNIYRVWAVRDGYASVVKATTATTPTRGSFYPVASFVIVDKPADAAELTGPRRTAGPAAPVQTPESIRASRLAAAVAYRDEYREFVATLEARGQEVPADLAATLAKYEARVAELA